MDSTAFLVLGIGAVSIFTWANIMLSWRAGAYGLIYYTPFMGLVIVAMSNFGMGSLALLSRDILIVAPLYFSLFFFTKGLPFHRVPWHVTVSFAVMAFIVIACGANPRIPNVLVALIGIKVWIGYVPLMFVGAVLVNTERQLLGLLRGMIVVAWVPWLAGVIQYVGALTIGFEETMTFMMGDYASIATGKFSCFDFGAPLCRLPGTFQFNSQYGVFCTFMLFPLFMFLALETDKGWKGFGSLSVALAFIAGFTSGARGNLLLMPACVLLIFFFRFRLKGGMQVVLGMAGAAVVVFNVMGIDADKAYGTTGQLGVDYGRDLVVGGFADGVAKGGLFGAGTGTNTGPARHAFDSKDQLNAEQGYYIENFMAKTLAELGIFGFFSLLFCFLMAGMHLLQGQFACKDPRLRDAAAVVTAMVAFTVATSVKGWALDVDPLNFFYYLFLGFGFAIPHLDRAKQLAGGYAVAPAGMPATQAPATGYAYGGRYTPVRSALPKLGARGTAAPGRYGRYGGRYTDPRSNEPK